MAMVTYDERSRRIQAANAPFAELAGVSLDTLLGSELDTLLAGWESGRAALPNGASVRVAALPQPPKDVQALAIVPETPATKVPDAGRYLDFWGKLARLWRAQVAPDLQAALEAALTAVQEISAADVLAVYRLLPDQPLLKRYCGLGAEGILPDELPAQELATLHRARLWEHGKRATGALQRSGRTAGLIYLAAAPLGGALGSALGGETQGDAERGGIGVVVVGGRSLPDPGCAAPSKNAAGAALVQPIVELLAAVVANLFQQASRIESLSAQVAIQERKLRLAQAVEDQATRGMIVLDTDLRITRMNLAAERILGYTGTEIAGAAVGQALIGDEFVAAADGLGAVLAEAIQGTSTYRTDDVRLYRRNGEVFLARLGVLAVSHLGRVERVIVFIDDLSEEEYTRLQTQQLEQRALLGEVMAVFAHEVRNPINNISTGLQVMAMDLLSDDPRQESIGRMLQDCDRLAELLRGVLAYARPSEYEMEPLEVGGLLRRLLERMQGRITAKNVQHSLYVEAGSPLVMGNLRALEQIFSNLVNNALQAMEAQGGRLILKVVPVSEDGRLYLEISVADTGPGITREAQERIFQPFFTTEKNGTGLGLAIVKRIVTAHKGSITLTSFPGGTIFRVRLPAMQKD
jgi:PAS domain S-box-containing protein